MRIKLSHRFGFNLWQIAASFQNYGANNCTFSIEQSNIREFQSILHEKIKLIPSTRGILPSYRTGRVYSFDNFPDIDMRDYIKAQPIFTDHLIIHIRGTDYLSHMPLRLQPTQAYFENVCTTLGCELSSCQIITDDPAYARHLIPHCKILATRNDLEAFHLMVGAKHLINSKSQFCFWVEYLRRTNTL